MKYNTHKEAVERKRKKPSVEISSSSSKNRKKRTHLKKSEEAVFFELKSHMIQYNLRLKSLKSKTKIPNIILESRI